MALLGLGSMAELGMEREWLRLATQATTAMLRHGLAVVAMHLPLEQEDLHDAVSR